MQPVSCSGGRDGSTGVKGIRLTNDDQIAVVYYSSVHFYRDVAPNHSLQQYFN